MPHASGYILLLLAVCLYMLANMFFGLFTPPQLALALSQWTGMGAVALGFRHVWMGADGIVWPRFGAWGLSGGRTLALIALGAVFALWANVMGGVIIELVPSLAKQALMYSARNRALLMPSEMWLAVIAALAVSVNAPLCEEFLFRGAILPATNRPGVAAWRAIVVNGVLFSLIHMSLVAALPLAVLGAALAHVTIKSRSIWPAVLVHALVNFINGVILPRMLPQTQDPQVLDSGVLFMSWAGLSFMCALLWWYVTRPNRPYSPSPLQPK